MGQTKAPIRVVSILGTTRPGSYTAMALALVNDELRRAGTSVTMINPATISLGFPGEPETDAMNIRQLVSDATGVVISTPEYHGSFSAMLKLVIENLGFPSALAGKPIALVGVAAGQIGAIKSLEQLRSVCSHVGGIVLPGPVSIANVRQVFDEDGNCRDKKTDARARRVATNPVDYLNSNVCPRFALEALAREATD